MTPSNTPSVAPTASDTRRELLELIERDQFVLNQFIGFFEYFAHVDDIEVADIKQLTDIMAALRATRVVNSVDRARS